MSTVLECPLNAARRWMLQVLVVVQCRQGWWYSLYDAEETERKMVFALEFKKVSDGQSSGADE